MLPTWCHGGATILLHYCDANHNQNCYDTVTPHWFHISSVELLSQHCHSNICLKNTAIFIISSQNTFSSFQKLQFQQEKRRMTRFQVNPTKWCFYFYFNFFISIANLFTN